MLGSPQDFSGKYPATIVAPKMYSLPSLLIITHVSLIIAQQDQYVSVRSCADQSCITMDQYAMKAAEYFTAGSTFIFLPGNHSSLIGINVSDVTNITLRRESDSSTYILCKNEVTLLFRNATNIYIEGLVFILYPRHKFTEPSALRVFDVSSVAMYEP